MSDDLLRIKPKVTPPLDPRFRPFFLTLREFQSVAKASNRPERITFALERSPNSISHFKAEALPTDHPEAHLNLEFAERILKSLLWMRGGYKAYVKAPAYIVDHLQKTYSPKGKRQFDYEFMKNVYEVDAMEIINASENDIPPEIETEKLIGRNLDGYRIGFDAGGSDRKVAALINGEEIFSVETDWQPKNESNPQYHIDGINHSIELAMKHLPKLDAIGVSSAGIYVNNRCMVASLFRKVPQDQFNSKIKDIYLNIAKKWGDTPIEIANDGDVTALAGSMSLGVNAVLGIAMGTSMAMGYVNSKGHITGWLNEPAFTPIDISNTAPQDTEWSGDFGTGVNYFSQDAVIRLAPLVGLKLDKTKPPGEILKDIQHAFAQGHLEIAKIYETIGVYLGYAILQFSCFYDIKHVLILGRVTSGLGGNIILEKAREVLNLEKPAKTQSITVNLPDEKMRRLGQSIAAASLPVA